MLELETAEMIARKIKLHPLTVRRMGYKGLIREYRVGRAVRYNPTEVIQLMTPKDHGRRSIENSDRSRQ